MTTTAPPTQPPPPPPPPPPTSATITPAQKREKKKQAPVKAAARRETRKHTTRDDDEADPNVLAANNKGGIAVEDHDIISMRTPTFALQDYVKVKADFGDPGTNNRPAGRGFIQEIHGFGGTSTYTVKYEGEDPGGTFKGIPLSDISPLPVVNSVFSNTTNTTNTSTPRRKRQKIQPSSSVAPCPSAETKSSTKKKQSPGGELVSRLRHALSNDKEKGWRRKELGWMPPPKANAKRQPKLTNQEKSQVLVDVALLETFLEAQGNGSGNGNGNNHYQEKDAVSGKFKKRVTKWNPMSIGYLVNHSWGLSNSYLCRLQKQQQQQQKANENAATGATFFEARKKASKKARCVIDDYELAEKLFTTSYLYAVSECRRQARANLEEVVDQKLYHQRFKAAKEKFKTLDDDTKAVWEFQRRAHLSRHATIKDQIIRARKTNPKCSWRSIEEEIDHWCCDATIRRWAMAREGGNKIL
ncbi:unnamed protein product [Cylindrotheca closterium]|uniref:Uncharacterized protein n=1 Tax=Cylindrotheca closterium TaxID=2856 RepID=A0AAD2GC14_9STRA|nr:unnamed protein product [Cylindrotheca closterium]